MSTPDRLLIFDILGPIAHFRKFYTSSSSLSYAYPPRTTITGIIAAILGEERDSYYKEFFCKNCKIAVSIRKPLRKIMQTINYIRTKKGPRTEAGRGGDGFSSAEDVIRHFITKPIIKYPTPLEIVFPQEYRGELNYRVYFWHSEDKIMDRLVSKITEGRSVYPLFLGLSEFMARVEFVDEIEGQNIKEYKNDEITEVVSVCNIEYIDEFDFSDCNTGRILQYIEEKVPVEFGVDREIKRNLNLVYEKNNLKIKARFNIPLINISYTELKTQNNITENILFME